MGGELSCAGSLFGNRPRNCRPLPSDNSSLIGSGRHELWLLSLFSMEQSHADSVAELAALAYISQYAYSRLPSMGSLMFPAQRIMAILRVKKFILREASWLVQLTNAQMGSQSLI